MTEKEHHRGEAPHDYQIIPQDTVVSASSSEFMIGQLVALRSGPTRVGAIINILPGTPENR